MASARSHVEEIARVAMGGHEPARRAGGSVVAALHQRLPDGPGGGSGGLHRPETVLKEHREQAEELIRIGRSGLENLFGHVAGQNYVLLLSDARGVTVDFMGDPTFDNQLRRAGLYLGSEWSENRAGTCAVGPASSRASR